MLRLESLRAFMAVVEQGSFSAAAKILGISKQLVSKHVSDLERELAVQLILRTTRWLRLTEAGSFFYERSRSVIRDLDSSCTEVAEFDGDIRGRLRVLVYGLFGETYIAPELALLSAKYPRLELDLQVESRLIDASEADFDLSFLYGPLPDSTMVATKIFDLDYIMVASPAYLDRMGVPRQPEDLARHNCLRSTMDGGKPWPYIVRGVERHIDVAGTWRSNNGLALIQACLNGLGICRLPEVYFRKYLFEGVLVQVFPAVESPPMPVWATFAAGKYVPLKVRTTIDFVRDRLAVLNGGAVSPMQTGSSLSATRAASD